jgi:uncharacterized protein YjbI with pentapeptide repeats
VAQEDVGSGAAAQPIAPNMASVNGNATGSTFATLKAGHSLITGSSWFNSFFHNSNLEGCTFQSCEIDGTSFENCSFRGVELSGCDVEGLVINGVRFGDLVELLRTTGT